VGADAAAFNIAVQPRDSDNNAQVTVSQSSINLNAGQSQQISVQLAGQKPAPGSYEGFLTISGGSTNLKVPYLYIVGDGVPYNIFPVTNGSFTGVVNDTDWFIGFKVIDRFGLPVTSYPVSFHVVSGGGVITGGDPTTDKVGVAGALVNLGSQPGDQIFTCTVGPLTVEFDGYARRLPVVSSVVDAATNQSGPLAPGASAIIRGSFLSDATKAAADGSTAIQLAGVSVSFDTNAVSAPGRLTSVSPGEIRLQIPPELAGESSAQMKVSIGGISSALVTVPVSAATAATETGGAAVRRHPAAAQ
jgi:hypothetical protein